MAAITPGVSGAGPSAILRLCADSTFGPLPTSKNHALPSGNITMYEQLVFLPSSARNSDVVQRFARNGVVQMSFTEIWMYGRVLPKLTCSANNALKISQSGHWYLNGNTQNTGSNWTPDNAYQERPDDWDSTNLSWEGCKLDIQYKPNGDSIEDDMPFESLAQGVRNMPTGYDELDLTRCVIHALQNPNTYMYPRDFASLTEQLGGPAVVCHGHTDAAVAGRHTWRSKTFNHRLRGGLIIERDDTRVIQEQLDSEDFNDLSVAATISGSTIMDEETGSATPPDNNCGWSAAPKDTFDIGQDQPEVYNLAEFEHGVSHRAPVVDFYNEDMRYLTRDYHYSKVEVPSRTDDLWNKNPTPIGMLSSSNSIAEATVFDKHGFDSLTRHSLREDAQEDLSTSKKHKLCSMTGFVEDNQIKLISSSYIRISGSSNNESNYNVLAAQYTGRFRAGTGKAHKPLKLPGAALSEDQKPAAVTRYRVARELHIPEVSPQVSKAPILDRDATLDGILACMSSVEDVDPQDYAETDASIMAEFGDLFLVMTDAPGPETSGRDEDLPSAVHASLAVPPTFGLEDSGDDSLEWQ